MDSFKIWWQARQPRERVLLGVMFALFAAVILWLGIYRPVESGLRQAALDNLEAAQRYANVARKVELLEKGSSAAIAASSLPVEQIVGQSAGEAGFTLERVQAQGNDRVDVAIASARSTALMGWIAALENNGVVIDSATIGPSGTTGTVTAQLSFKRAGS